jgi:prevent-host-death family protein
VEAAVGSWPIKDAEVRLSEVLEAARKDGPQVLTDEGHEAAVLVPIEDWRRLQTPARRTLKELLLADTPRFDFPLPTRPSTERHNPADIE